MKCPTSFSWRSIEALVLCLTTATWAAPFDSRALAQGTPAQQTVPTLDLERAAGQWHSTERFEEESRITVAFRRQGSSIQGWAVLLGQKRKADNRATLALSFCDATWDGRRFLFNTILPEDGGTIGWELRVTTPTTAVLRALTENGEPIPDELRWDMTR